MVDQISQAESHRIIGRLVKRKIHLNREVQIKECDSMVPLKRRTAGGVISPLKEC